MFGLVTSTHIIIANIGSLLLNPTTAVSRAVDGAAAGDSRSVLGTGGRTVPMSFDHKPNNVFVCNV